MTDTSILEQIKRPENEEEITTDRIILHSARIASFAQHESEAVGDVYFRSALDDPEHKARTRAWIDAITRYMTAVQIPYILDLVQKANPDLADEIARKLWHAVEMGDVFDEWLWEIYYDRDIDPQAVADAVSAHVASREADRG
ncbi:hypothetical protein [Microbacterium plantarum]|uniref:hypothetical protein n=1 Tax=Microbacterium plantarum TaxID=1816425 RepID=UPI002B48A8C4|nr:hypothetical protein [Microbacterium plantarum]WRK16516.1 hypothetical protein VC184_11420 [Microbacterium plantarum]